MSRHKTANFPPNAHNIYPHNPSTKYRRCLLFQILHVFCSYICFAVCNRYYAIHTWLCCNMSACLLNGAIKLCCCLFCSDCRFALHVFKWLYGHLKIFQKHSWIHLKMSWNEPYYFEITPDAKLNIITRTIMFPWGEKYYVSLNMYLFTSCKCKSWWFYDDQLCCLIL